MDAFERAEEMAQLVPGFQYLYSGGGSREVIPRLLKMGWGLCAEGVEAGRDVSHGYLLRRKGEEAWSD